MMAPKSRPLTVILTSCVWPGMSRKHDVWLIFTRSESVDARLGFDPKGVSRFLRGSTMRFQVKAELDQTRNVTLVSSDSFSFSPRCLVGYRAASAGFRRIIRVKERKGSP
jgi:hypothetical protein